MQMQTERLLIRPFTEGDLDAFMAYRNNKEWMRYQGFKGLDKPAYRRALLGEPILESGVQLAVTRRQDGVLLGDLYLKKENATLYLGYTIAPAYARLGYAFEAAREALRWAHTNGYHTLSATVEPGNLPSVRLLQKLGFQFTGRNADGEDVYEAATDASV
ncbi:MAG: GNAT family N-acetyltransferase [Eubacteriales bacterium]|nr:GNAT family N-acetyltransferase [Eubacteriales bacterium]